MRVERRGAGEHLFDELVEAHRVVGGVAERDPRVGATLFLEKVLHLGNAATDDLVDFDALLHLVPRNTEGALARPPWR